MLRHAILASFVLLICSEALAVTLVPLSLSSTSQTVQVQAFSPGGNNGQTITATDPTDATATWSLNDGSAGSAETKLLGGMLQLTFQGSLVPIDRAVTQALHSFEFTVPDFGSPATPVALTLTLNSSSLTGIEAIPFVLGQVAPSNFHNPLSVPMLGYFSSLLNSNVSFDVPQIQFPPTSSTAKGSIVMDFLAGDTVQIDLGSFVDYQGNGATTGSFSQALTLQAFAIEPTPEPSTSLLFGSGLLVLGFRSRRSIKQR